MGPLLRSVDAVVEEIMRLHRSLPPRPTIEEIEAAASLVRHVDEEAARVESLSRQSKGPGIPDELFFVLLEMQKNLVCFNSREQKREALKLLDLENIHVLFDEMIQRASNCLPSSSSNVAVTAAAAGVKSDVGSSSTVSPVFHTEKEVARSSDRVARDDSYVKKAKSVMCADGIASESHASHGISSMNSTIRTDATSGESVANYSPISSKLASLMNKLYFALVRILNLPAYAIYELNVTCYVGEDREKLSLIKLASLIEVSAKKGTRDLNLQNKLMDQIDWLPDSLGKLSNLISLDLSENRIVVLPTTIGSLSSLTKLDLHSNRIVQLPDTIGDLHNLLYLDLRGNQLSLLPSTFGKLVQLEEVDLSSNQLLSLPDSIGNLIRLKKLNIETNDIEELPHTIGHCASLVELRADYNRLKALPEAIGKLESLEILSVRYNNIKGLPTTMASLPKLKEIDVSFNELESVPESLCLVTTLVKLNLGNNFADLQSLPRSIGNLEMLEELDISNNQIRVLPDSFRMLLRLRILRAEENPLEVPPRHIAEMGAQVI